MTVHTQTEKAMSFTLIATKSKKHGDSEASITEWHHAFATNLTMGVPSKKSLHFQKNTERDGESRQDTGR